MAEAPEQPESIEFSATLPVAMRGAVEKLFFFNHRQGERLDAIHMAINRAGLPALVIKDDRISIGVPSESLQCLFACRSESHEPLGVALYGRPDPATLWVAHLAVCDESTRAQDGSDVAHLIVWRIMELASMIRGVERIELPYQRGAYLRLNRARYSELSATYTPNS